MPNDGANPGLSADWRSAQPAAGKMDFSKKYTEKEVNEIIKSSIAFSDIELVRREMYQYKFIGRLKDGSEYWAEESWMEMYKQYAV